MGRLPNHRFSKVRKREITTLEANFDLVKYQLKRAFTGTQGRKGFLARSLQNPISNMGKNNKRQGYESDWDETAADEDYESGQRAHQNGNRARVEVNPRERSRPDSRKVNIEKGEVQGETQNESNVDFGLYLEVVDDLKTQFQESHKALDKAHIFFTEQAGAIEEAVKNKRKLQQIMLQNNKLGITIDTLREFEQRNEEDYRMRLSRIEQAEQKLQVAEERVKDDQKRIEEDKENLKKRKGIIEAEQAVQLQELQAKLAEEQEQRYTKRVELLETETKERREEDKKKMTKLEDENNKLLDRLKQEQSKNSQVEKKLKDADKLKSVYEDEAEHLKQDLKRGENEFGLNTEPIEFYKERFLKIYEEIHDISSQYFQELEVEDLDEVHKKIEEADGAFASVPISKSETSQKLRVAHAQRVISSQLRVVIWKPFSSEITLQEPKSASLLEQISSGLADSSDNGKRAARVHAALTMRGLQSQSMSSQYRENSFTDKVMAILSVLVKVSKCSGLRKSLLDLAGSAASLWDIAQTDEREFIVYPTLSPENFEGWHKDIPAAHQRVIVLLPQIIARRYPRILDSRPVGPPGGWVETEQERHVEETLIYLGRGLEGWSGLVLDGEYEEAERRNTQAIEEAEEEKRLLEEKVKVLETQGPGHKRRSSQNRRDSLAGSSSVSPSSPSAIWMKGGGQKIPE